ncbi:hypothetical protein LTV02_30560 [Nocardia yamanashiensis]|uniref:hypothetical protein n=1 Tax=Nocardia yamanashiensis TaxID=209247 RepID=UPI001E6008F0|nr:hypothetical protein [Nocardia yamanashiensis]UGT40325.1 hypothetical protein LTV02_30560 [Nocardia yamanashiensis]
MSVSYLRSALKALAYEAAVAKAAMARLADSGERAVQQADAERLRTDFMIMAVGRPI